MRKIRITPAGTGCVIYFIYGAIILLGTIGWIMNIVKMTKCDFQEPYRAETIRVVGTAIPVIGAVTGWLTIEDSKPIVKPEPPKK
jgi:hypothetical protein